MAATRSSKTSRLKERSPVPKPYEQICVDLTLDRGSTQCLILRYRSQRPTSLRIFGWFRSLDLSKFRPLASCVFGWIQSQPAAACIRTYRNRASHSETTAAPALLSYSVSMCQPPDNSQLSATQNCMLSLQPAGHMCLYSAFECRHRICKIVQHVTTCVVQMLQSQAMEKRTNQEVSCSSPRKVDEINILE